MVKWNEINEDAGQRKPAITKVYPELSTVRLLKDVEVNGRMLPKGSAGTVVAAYSDGEGYEVEFETPFHAVVTLESSDISS